MIFNFCPAGKVCGSRAGFGSQLGLSLFPAFEAMPLLHVKDVPIGQLADCPIVFTALE